MARQTLLIEQPKRPMPSAGDRNAPPGSREWAIAVRLDIMAGLHEASATAEHLERLRNLFRRHNGWQQLGFKSYEAFCAARELDGGLGRSADQVEGIIQERKLMEHGGDRRSGRFQGSTTSLKHSSRGGWLARLERDAPTKPAVAAELERVQAGKSTAHAAAVRLGWRSPKHCKSCRCFESGDGHD